MVDLVERPTTVSNYKGMREWLDRVDAIGELRRVNGATWEEDIGRIAEMLDALADSGITRRALDEKHFELQAWDPRDYATDNEEHEVGVRCRALESGLNGKTPYLMN